MSLAYESAKLLILWGRMLSCGTDVIGTTGREPGVFAPALIRHSDCRSKPYSKNPKVYISH